MLTHLKPTRLTPIFSLALCLLPLTQGGGVRAQRAAGPRAASAPARATIRVAVLPFRNSLARQASGSDDASVLGDGIADSLTNGLKGVQGLSVIDSELVLRAAAKFPGAEVTATDDDARRVADSLSAQVIVAGSFQLLGNHLHVDARLLTVDPAAQAPARKMTADAAYPEGYSGLLDKLQSAILLNLKVPLGRLNAATSPGGLAGTRSQQAYAWYVRGIRRMRAGAAAGELSQAIQSFDRALAIDPDYAQALAAKSEAETQLYELKRAHGERDDALGRAALDDALGSVRAAPGSGRGHRAVARAQAARGDYASAAESAGQARRAWPADSESAVLQARALSGGRLVRSPETDRLLLDRPDLALSLPELPKILAVNNSDYGLTLKFTPAEGPPYPAVSVGPGSSRIIPVFPGSYRIAIESEAGRLEQQATFEPGRDYQLTYSAESFPAGTFTFVNTGGHALQIRVSGPLTKSLTVPPRGSQSLPVPPGSYSVTGRVQTAVTTGRYEISAGQEERIEYTYSVGREVVFSPSRLTIENSGNATLTVGITGPKRLTVQVPALGSRSLTLPSGTYALRFTCGRSEVVEYDLGPGEETVVSQYGCRRHVYR